MYTLLFWEKSNITIIPGISVTLQNIPYLISTSFTLRPRNFFAERTFLLSLKMRAGG